MSAAADDRPPAAAGPEAPPDIAPPPPRGLQLREPLLALGGLGVWGLHFTAIYMANALVCARNWQDVRWLGWPAGSAAILALSALLLAVLALMLRAAWPAMAADPADGGEAEPRFLRWVGVAGTLYAMLAVALETLPAVMVPACGY